MDRLQSLNSNHYLFQPKVGGYSLNATKTAGQSSVYKIGTNALDHVVDPSRAYNIGTTIIKSAYMPEKRQLFDEKAKLISISLSCIMMMAINDTNITGQELYYTYKYLDSITDDYGSHPPNIQNMLNYMQFAGFEIPSTLDFDGYGYDDDDDGEGGHDEVKNEEGVKSKTSKQKYDDGSQKNATKANKCLTEGKQNVPKCKKASGDQGGDLPTVEGIVRGEGEYPNGNPINGSKKTVRTITRLKPKM